MPSSFAVFYYLDYLDISRISRVGRELGPSMVGLGLVQLGWVTNLQFLYGLGLVTFGAMLCFCGHSGTAECRLERLLL